jgi:REP element-mobilizing transposase RayT
MNQYDPNKHHRHSIRNPNWDYRSPGYYFVTICTYQRQNLFENQEFNDIAAHALGRIPEQAHARHIKIDEWIVMPNHIHVIFIFIDYPPQADMSRQAKDFPNALAGSLGVIVGRYKTAVTSRINNMRVSKGADVWQRGYYERIIRNEREWHATQQYIANNPLRWQEDRDNLDELLSKMTYHS